MVSGLDAAVSLLQLGHTIEAGVLLRTIDDFIGDFSFVDDALDDTRPMTTAARQFIENYFLESLDPLKRHTSRAHKVRAAEARKLKPRDPHEVVAMSRNIDGLYDAFVHGDYAPVMDIYAGQTNGTAGRFEALGVTDLSAVAVHRLMLAIYVYRVTVHGFDLASRLGLGPLAKDLNSLFRSFDNQAAFEDL